MKKKPKLNMPKINHGKNNKEHPNIKAIMILEFIAERIGKPKIFDCSEKKGALWYELEDEIMRIIKEK